MLKQRGVALESQSPTIQFQVAISSMLFGIGLVQGDSKKSVPFCFCSYLVNRLTKLHEILTEDTSIRPKCCVKNSKGLFGPSSLTNRLRKKMRISGLNT